MYNAFNPNTWIGVNVNNYQEIERAQVPMDGSPMLFMLNTEQTFYVVSMQNGRKTISGYSFTALPPVEPPTGRVEVQGGTNTLEERMTALESVLGEIRGMLKEKEEKSNEPSRTTTSKTKSNQ